MNPEYCWKSWNYSNISDPDLTEQVGFHFCLIYGAVLLQYIIFCFFLLTILVRCWCNRRKKREHTKRFSFTLPDAERGGENVMPTSCQINNENFELGKLRKDNNKRVSDAYSVVRFTESSNMYATSIADDQKNANNPNYSRVRLLGGKKPSSSHAARNDSVLLEESIELSSPPRMKPPHEEDAPPIPTKPRNSMILMNTSNFNLLSQQQTPPSSCTKQETLTITPEIDISNLPPPEDNDASSTYSMAGQYDEDGGSQCSVHYSTISRSSADIYSLADSNADKEPADYEDFYSVPRDGIEEAAYMIPHRKLPNSANAQGRDSATTTTRANEGSGKVLPENRSVTRTPHGRFEMQSRTVRGTRENILGTSGDSRKRSLSANIESQHEPVTVDPSLCKNTSFRTNKRRSPQYENI